MAGLRVGSGYNPPHAAITSSEPSPEARQRKGKGGFAIKQKTKVRFCCFFLGVILIYGLYLPVRAVAQVELNMRLINAINHEDAVAVRKVLALGADANTRSGAAALRFRQVIELLMGRKNVMSGEPALSLALDEKHHGFTGEKSCATADGIVRDLLEHGASVEAKSSVGRTPLMQAAWEGCQGSIDALVQYGADVNAQADCGYTVVMYAVMSHDDRVVKQILDYGANPKPTLQNRLWPESLIGCTEWTPQEYKDRMNRIHQLILRARKAHSIKPSAS